MIGPRPSTEGRVRTTRPTPGRGQRTRKTAYLVLWWLDQTPYVALFRDELEAEAAARVRNATVIELRGEDIDVSRVVDYYRRDEAGRPIPAKWKDFGKTRKPRRAFPGGVSV